MQRALAQLRYQQRYIEPGIPHLHSDRPIWQQALVIPAYREHAVLVEKLNALSSSKDGTLILLILNRPDSDTDPLANQVLRSAIRSLPHHPLSNESTELFLLDGGGGLLLQDTESTFGPLPADQGVGLARKIGCDIAWQWMMDGAIDSKWIFNTDADAHLPADYFQRPCLQGADAVAAVYPFVHVPGEDTACNQATALYELYLHHYVLGLEYAESPFAYHTLGSSLAIRADAYAKVRGFPRRAGGEDFYLLGKARKLGAVARLEGRCIELQSRISHRTPFGTGPAVARIACEAGSPGLFYHPDCFECLRALLEAVTRYQPRCTEQIRQHLESFGLNPVLARHSATALAALNLDSGLAHCHRQSRDSNAFQRHFHQWFDAFRTLKFIHAMRDLCLPMQTRDQLIQRPPHYWPEAQTEDSLNAAIQAHWGWTH